MSGTCFPPKLTSTFPHINFPLLLFVSLVFSFFSLNLFMYLYSTSGISLINPKNQKIKKKRKKEGFSPMDTKGKWVTQGKKKENQRPGRPQPSTIQPAQPHPGTLASPFFFLVSRSQPPHARYKGHVYRLGERTQNRRGDLDDSAPACQGVHDEAGGPIPLSSHPWYLTLPPCLPRFRH